MKNRQALRRAVAMFGVVLPIMLGGTPVHAALPGTKLIPPVDLPDAAGQAPSGTTLVSPGNDAAWAFASEGIGGPGTVTPGTYQGYGLAPSGAPAGVGALHQVIGAGNNADRLQFGTNIFGGRHLGSISELRFSTWTPDNGPAANLTSALHLTVDLDGDGFYTGFTNDDIIVFESIYQNASRPMLDPTDSTASQCGNPCVLDATWQTWDARGGRWYSRRGDGTTRWNGQNFESLEHYLSRYPSAQIALNPASLSFRAGAGWSKVETYIDALTVDGAVYDFEPTIESITTRSPAWRFETAIDGASEFSAKWSDEGSHQGFVDGPAFTGSGALRQVIGSAGVKDHVSFGTTKLAGTRLDSLTDLSYATFLEPGSSLRPPVLSVRLDLDGNGVWQNNTVDDTLQFIGNNQSTPVITGAWQHWSTIGGVWYSRQTLSTTTFAAYLAAHPDATVALSDASVMVLLGSGYTNVRSYVDSISVNGTLFDIEPAIQTVTPADGGGGWFYSPPLSQDESASDRQMLVNGPGQPPAGVGSLSQKTTATRLDAVTPMFAGKRLRDLTALSYWTYRKSTSAQMPALRIHLDRDGDNVFTSSAVDTALVFEPAYQHSGYVTPGQGALASNTWQRWNALEGGWWVSSGSVNTGACTTGTAGPPVCRLADILDTPVPGGSGTLFGDLTVTVGPGSINLSVSATNSPDVFADRLNVNGTVFDFEAAVPSRLPTQLDGNRSSDEGYQLVATDSAAENGTGEVQIYATCSDTDVYLYVESPTAVVSSADVIFDVNANDRYDNGQDRVAKLSSSGATTAGAPIPGSETRQSFDGDSLEVKIPRSFGAGGWFQYDVTLDSGRNTGWGDLVLANAKRFIPDPCTYIPLVINGAIAVDCDRTTDDLRLVQHTLDRGLGTTVKLAGTCNVGATPPHGGDQVSVDAAAFVLERDGTVVESLDPTNKARVVGSGTQAAFYVAPGTKDATIRGLWMQGLSRGVVAHNSIRTTVGHTPPGFQQISPLGNRILGVSNLQEGILAVGAGDGMGSTATTVTLRQGNLQGGTRTYSTTGTAKDLVDVRIAGNYVSYNPPGPLTPMSDVTGIVVRQNGGGHDVLGVDVRQNAVGMAASEFPSFNYAGIRIHGDSNDPNFAHIKDVVVFKNTLGRIEELNLGQIEPTLPDAGDLQATGRTGIAIGRVQNFDVRGNSIRTILSTVPGVNMIGGGIVVYDSFDGEIVTNSVITIAGPETADEDLGAIGIVDDLMNVFNASGASGKPTRDIVVERNYVGWSGDQASDFGAQRGMVVNGAWDIRTVQNQFKVTSAESILISVPISGIGTALGGSAQLPAKAVMNSKLCTNWLGTYKASGQPQDTPPSEVRFGGRTNGSSGNSFPGGGVFSSNTGC